jgi:hypothetical protein
MGNDGAIKPKARIGNRAKAEIDPLFTMRCLRQLVASGGNGFRLTSQFSRLGHGRVPVLGLRPSARIVRGYG